MSFLKKHMDLLLKLASSDSDMMSIEQILYNSNDINLLKAIKMCQSIVIK